jgi:glycosyltransferase involved in cell wall biosynthesis
LAETGQSIRYSIVIPLYNERESLMPLYQRLKETMEAVGRPFECIFVDDGSSDGSLTLLQEIALVDSRITVVGLQQNAGKSVALSAAFSLARGEFIITMDGDLIPPTSPGLSRSWKKDTTLFAASGRAVAKAGCNA